MTRVCVHGEGGISCIHVSHSLGQREVLLFPYQLVLWRKKGEEGKKEKGLDGMIVTIDDMIDDGGGGFHWRRKRKEKRKKKEGKKK